MLPRFLFVEVAAGRDVLVAPLLVTADPFAKQRVQVHVGAAVVVTA
jgi:hypothetical protein